MCGRYSWPRPTRRDRGPGFRSARQSRSRRRYNVAPGDDVLAVTTDREGEPRGELLRWGLVPSWAEEPEHRPEDDQRPGRDGGRAPGVPPRVRALPLPDRRRRLLRMAARVRAVRSSRSTSPATTASRSRSPACGRSGTATTAASCAPARSSRSRPTRPIAPLHDRMPIILVPEQRAAWLDAATPTRPSSHRLLAGLPPSRTALRAVELGRQRRSLRRPRMPCPGVPKRPGGPVLAAAAGYARLAPHSPLHRPLSPRTTTCVLDLDGCVWVGEHVHAAAPRGGRRAPRGRQVDLFVTNDARRSPEDYVRKLWSLGAQGLARGGGHRRRGDPARARRARPRRGGTYVIGSPAIFRHVADAGQRIVNGTAGETEAECRGRRRS